MSGELNLTTKSMESQSELGQETPKVAEKNNYGNTAKKSNPIKDFLCGGFGGICTVVTGHPLDTIKVRLQTMPVPAPGQSPLYRGTYDCAKQTIQREGVRGLYKGMAAPISGVAPIFAISFFGNGLGKSIIQNVKGTEKLTNADLFYAGAFSGIFTTSIMAPGERIKTILQVQQGGGPQKYSGPNDVVRQLYKEGGLRSIYKGTCATLLRDVPASGMYFLTYQVVKDAMTPEGSSASDIGLLRTITAGGMAGIANWGIGMPADVLKSRLQSAPEGRYPKGVRSVFTELMRNEGVTALYKGFTPVMLRAFPANAACFMGFEFCLKFLGWIAPNW